MSFGTFFILAAIASVILLVNAHWRNETKKMNQQQLRAFKKELDDELNIW